MHTKKSAESADFLFARPQIRGNLAAEFYELPYLYKVGSIPSFLIL